MTIHSPDLYCAALWDWGFLDDCFPGTRTRVSDIDGIVERKGRFLVIEAKGVNTRIPTGQLIMFEAMANKGMTVLIVWGNPNEPEQMQIWYPHRPYAEPAVPASVDDIRDVVRRWFNWASGIRGVR